MNNTAKPHTSRYADQPNMTNLPPTKKQIEVLNHITKYMTTNGYAPTERELAIMIDGPDGTISTAKYYLVQLTKKGLIRREPHRAYRNIVLTKQAKSALNTT